MDSQKRLLSILHIVYGGLHILLFVFGALLINTILPFIMSEINQSNPDAAMIVEMVVMFVRSILFVLIVVVPLPSLIGGIAQLYNRDWGMPLMMISGCLSLLNIPIGTALGVYTIWVFLENNKAKAEKA